MLGRIMGFKAVLLFFHPALIAHVILWLLPITTHAYTSLILSYCMAAVVALVILFFLPLAAIGACVLRTRHGAHG